MRYPTLGRGGALLLALTITILAPPGRGQIVQAHPLTPQSKAEAAKVAKKVERAKSRAAKEAKHELEAVRDFTKRLDRYERLHNNYLARLGGQTAVTAQGLFEAIVKDRAKAEQGDVFISEIRPLLKRLIAEQQAGADGGALRKALVEGNPGAGPEPDTAPVPVLAKVNLAYPEGATRSTMPPSILLTLPTLPECLHYRFVGRDLLLVDSVAQNIVDVLTNAAPPLGGK